MKASLWGYHPQHRKHVGWSLALLDSFLRAHSIIHVTTFHASCTACIPAIRTRSTARYTAQRSGGRAVVKTRASFNLSMTLVYEEGPSELADPKAES